VRVAACLVLASLLMGVPAASAGDPGEGRDLLAFADSLCEAGDYFRAIGEYKRLLYREPKGSALANRARLHMAVCYGRAGGYEEAVELLRDLGRREIPEAEPALFELAVVYYQAGFPERAAEAFEHYRSRFPAGPRAEEALLLAGFSRLTAADYAAAAAIFEGLERQAVPCAAELAQAAREPALPERSPLVAGLLSAALPGAGQLYCGRPAQAAASFLLTGVSVFAAWAALSNGYEGAGTLAAIVSATIYAGGIRSAVGCAGERNLRARQGWLAGLASRCSIKIVPGGMILSY
jgi:TM2 domain-containing membrane protein YozV